MFLQPSSKWKFSEKNEKTILLLYASHRDMRYDIPSFAKLKHVLGV